METQSDEFLLFIRALHFAAERHKEQRRKGKEKEPYINHLIHVVSLLYENGNVRDWSVLIAGVLHDTIEDTKTSKLEILQLFGKEIAEIVMEVTDDKNLPAEKRKLLQIESANHKSPKAKLVKIADKISNIYDITISPPENWSKQRKIDYFSWAENVVAGLRGSNDELEKLFDILLKEGREKLNLS
jgi:GTP diphosphokinase / guanosine-3',5'-bis(diphosphate) 3'-diphosphatase